MEKWVDVKYNSNYEVSNLGVVRRKYFTKVDSIGRNLIFEPKIMKPCFIGDKNTRGMYVGITLQGKTYRLHRVVFFSFNLSSDEKLEINHIDHNKSNNHLNNLELVTSKENKKAFLIFNGYKINEDVFCKCGVNISKNCKQCNNCENVDRLIDGCMTRPSLGTLLKDVYSVGYEATGRKYGVSGNSIRKWILQWHKIMD